MVLQEKCPMCHVSPCCVSWHILFLVSFMTIFFLVLLKRNLLGEKINPSIFLSPHFSLTILLSLNLPFASQQCKTWRFKTIRCCRGHGKQWRLGKRGAWKSEPWPYQWHHQWQRGSSPKAGKTPLSSGQIQAVWCSEALGEKVCSGFPPKRCSLCFLHSDKNQMMVCLRK